MDRRPAARPRSGYARGAGRPGEGDRLVELELHELELPAGGACALEVDVPIAALYIGGQEYRAEPEAPRVSLDVVQLVNGWHFRLRGRVTVVGPCWRCLEPARPGVAIDASEVAIDGADDPEMTSLYLRGGVLEVAAWARDAVAEALPPAILCDAQCAGLCATCGANLNEGPCGCAQPAPDSRWSALAELAERLARERSETPRDDDVASQD
jgi:uncharacterized protein